MRSTTPVLVLLFIATVLVIALVSFWPLPGRVQTSDGPRVQREERKAEQHTHPANSHPTPGVPVTRSPADESPTSREDTAPIVRLDLSEEAIRVLRLLESCNADLSIRQLAELPSALEVFRSLLETDQLRECELRFLELLVLHRSFENAVTARVLSLSGCDVQSFFDLAEDPPQAARTIANALMALPCKPEDPEAAGRCASVIWRSVGGVEAVDAILAMLRDIPAENSDYTTVSLLAMRQEVDPGLLGILAARLDSLPVSQPHGILFCSMCLERLARDARRRGETALLQETKLALHQWAVRVIGDVERVGHDVSQDQRNVALAAFCRIEGALKDEESDVARMIAQVRHPDDTLRGMAADSVGHYLSEVVPSPEMRLRMLDEVSDLLMDDTAWFDALQILKQADPDWRTRVRSVIASGRLGEATEDVLRRSLDQ